MALDLSLIGRAGEPATFDYGWKDVVLYALGIGAKADELDYLYEGRGPKTYPSFAVIPTFAPMFGLLAKSGGDLAMVVHGAQKVVLHEPIPAEGKLSTVATVRAVYDLKKFASVVVDTKTVERTTGRPLFDTTWTIIFRGEGGFGGAPPPREAIELPAADAKPDFRQAEPTAKESALLYRLCGDLNPLHADPTFAAKVGFPQGPILHGLCTYGHMVRAIVKHAAGGDASRVRAFEAQFRKPVWPGDTIVTDGFRRDGGRWLVSVGVAERPDAVITHASALVVD
jgi:acyl dehydratase